MNKVVLMGRLTRDPDVRYTEGERPLAIARYTLAVNRRFKRENEPDADFINCIAFGHAGEFAEKYLKQGMKITISGRIQTGSYTNKDGMKVYTTDVVVEEQEFAESKKGDEKKGSNGKAHANANGSQKNRPGFGNPQSTDSDNERAVSDDETFTPPDFGVSTPNNNETSNIAPTFASGLGGFS